METTATAVETTANAFSMERPSSTVELGIAPARVATITITMVAVEHGSTVVDIPG
jgi:hypothetical protein